MGRQVPTTLPTVTWSRVTSNRRVVKVHGCGAMPERTTRVRSRVVGFSLYEHLITRGLAELLGRRAGGEVERTELEDSDAPLLLARHAEAELFRSLRALRGGDALPRQIALTNRVLALVRELVPEGLSPDPDVEPPGRASGRARALRQVLAAAPHRRSRSARALPPWRPRRAAPP